MFFSEKSLLQSTWFVRQRQDASLPVATCDALPEDMAQEAIPRPKGLAGAAAVTAVAACSCRRAPEGSKRLLLGVMRPTLPTTWSE